MDYKVNVQLKNFELTQDNEGRMMIIDNTGHLVAFWVGNDALPVTTNNYLNDNEILALIEIGFLVARGGLYDHE